MKQFLYVYFNSDNVPLDRYLGFQDEIQPEELNLSVLKSKKLTHFCVFHSTLGKSFISMIIMSFFRERTSYYITLLLGLLLSTKLLSSMKSEVRWTHAQFTHLDFYPALFFSRFYYFYDV